MEQFSEEANFFAQQSVTQRGNLTKHALLDLAVGDDSPFASGVLASHNITLLPFDLINFFCRVQSKYFASHNITLLPFDLNFRL